MKKVPSGTYAISVEGNAADGFIVTNSHKPETVHIRGKKTWDDAGDQDGKRPETIVIRLLKNGTEIKNETVSGPEWAWDFGELPKYENKTPVSYTITEDGVDEYGTHVSGFSVTNSYTLAQTSVTVTKAWDDANDQDGLRPASVTVRLLADGAEADSVLLNASNHWTHTFEPLDEYRDGKRITYTVEEDDSELAGKYTAAVTGDAVDGFVITNTHTPETVDISGSKTWDDGEDQDGKRPASVTIRLLADGDEVDRAVVGEAENWAWAFTGKPKYSAGTEIEYTIAEDEVAEYESSVNGFDVTNAHTPEKTDISVSKVWEDEDDGDRIRPASVTVDLLADGEETGLSLTLDETNGWSGTFEDLDVYAEGVRIEYGIREELTDVITGEDGPGTYTVQIGGSPAEGFTVTNTHTALFREFEVIKVWQDNNNAHRTRPQQITVSLLADGEETGDELNLSEENDWCGSFTGLMRRRDGVPVVYSVEEKDVPAYYRTVIHGTADEGRILIENTELPAPPEFFSLEGELPRTGITAPRDSLRKESIAYDPVNMSLQIPSLEITADVVSVRAEDGTYPVSQLGMNAGLLEGTAIPGEGFSVLVGHNTLSAEDYGPFVRIGMLEKGDRLFVTGEDGELLIFEVFANEKIGSRDVEGLYRIASKYGSTLTLMTCEDETITGGYAARRVIAARRVGR